ncbi:MAG: hypothetical protein R3E12_07940 [Candidatus Eisenbacteria bacterium]
MIFASNMEDPAAGTRSQAWSTSRKELERITYEDTFDGFPMYSPDAKYLVFASNRGSEREGETNIFLAEWVD